MACNYSDSDDSSTEQQTPGQNRLQLINNHASQKKNRYIQQRRAELYYLQRQRNLEKQKLQRSFSGFGGISPYSLSNKPSSCNILDELKQEIQIEDMKGSLNGKLFEINGQCYEPENLVDIEDGCSN